MSGLSSCLAATFAVKTSPSWINSGVSRNIVGARLFNWTLVVLIGNPSDNAEISVVPPAFGPTSNKVKYSPFLIVTVDGTCIRDSSLITKLISTLTLKWL